MVTPALPQAATTPVFRALGHTFAVRTDDPAAYRLICNLFESLAHDGAAVRTYVVSRAGPTTWSIQASGASVTTATTFAQLLEILLWQVNRAAVESADDAVILHAAAATHVGRALVLPGQSGAGKSTVVGTLVRRGFGYLTDEASAIVPESLLVRAFPKPLCIEVGSQPVFPDLAPYPLGDPDSEPGPDPSPWLVPPERLRLGAAASDSPIGWIVVIAFEAGATAELVRMDRGQAAIELARHWFRPAAVTASHLETLAAVARTVPAYRLRFGNVASAADTIEGLIAHGPGRSHSRP